MKAKCLITQRLAGLDREAKNETQKNFHKELVGTNCIEKSFDVSQVTL